MESKQVVEELKAVHELHKQESDLSSSHQSDASHKRTVGKRIKDGAHHTVV
jgi:hypothetical protein